MGDGRDAENERFSAQRARLNDHPISRLLGVSIEELRPGYSRCHLHTSERNLGGVHGSVHGGVLAFMIDVAMLGAVTTLIEPGERAAGTAELNVSYLRPAFGPTVVAEAQILHKGRVLVVGDIEISDGHGKLFAKGRVGYAVRQDP
jgi:uncharacterized protein (TIGR00369 family)